MITPKLWSGLKGFFRRAHNSMSSGPLTRLAVSREIAANEDLSHLEQEETFHSRPSIRIVIPDNLKALLVDDWERVTKNGAVVSLPAPKPVRQVLQDWRDEEAPKRVESRIDIDVLDEVIMGILEYFDTMLDKLLLYRYERPQYRLLREKYVENEDKTPVDVYGAEHLIRLFSKFTLPQDFAQYKMFRVLSAHRPIFFARSSSRAARSDKHGSPGHAASPRRTVQVFSMVVQEL